VCLGVSLGTPVLVTKYCINSCSTLPSIFSCLIWKRFLFIMLAFFRGLTLDNGLYVASSSYRAVTSLPLVVTIWFIYVFNWQCILFYEQLCWFVTFVYEMKWHYKLCTCSFARFCFRLQLLTLKVCIVQLCLILASVFCLSVERDSLSEKVEYV